VLFRSDGKKTIGILDYGEVSIVGTNGIYPSILPISIGARSNGSFPMPIGTEYIQVYMNMEKAITTNNIKKYFG
jgi:hypothetical protein